ncbi:MAG: TlpA disulfide reductase family protein [Bacteroidota bacterium]
MRETIRAWWMRPAVQRATTVASWVALLVLGVLVVQRYVPDYRLPDLGPAPAVAHVALDGETVRLGDYAGQVVVVNVWATWCPPCVVETPGFVDLQAAFAGDVQFLGVSVDDDPEAVRAFAARYGVTYPMLVGPNRAGPPLAAPVLPTTYVIDRSGRVRLRHEGLLLEPALRPVLRSLVDEAPPRG